MKFSGFYWKFGIFVSCVFAVRAPYERDRGEAILGELSNIWNQFRNICKMWKVNRLHPEYDICYLVRIKRKSVSVFPTSGFQICFFK